MDAFKRALNKVKELAEYAEMLAEPEQPTFRVGVSSAAGRYILLHNSNTTSVHLANLRRLFTTIGIEADMVASGPPACGTIRLLHVRAASTMPAVLATL